MRSPAALGTRSVRPDRGCPDHDQWPRCDGRLRGCRLAYVGTALYFRVPVPVQPLKAFAAAAIALGLMRRRCRRSPADGDCHGPPRGHRPPTGRECFPSSWSAHPGKRRAVAHQGSDRARREGKLAPPSPCRPLRQPRGRGGLLRHPALNPARPATAWQSAGPRRRADCRDRDLRSPLGSSWAALVQIGIPDGGSFAAALGSLVLAQIPLTFGNSVVATADAECEYFGARAERVRPGRLAGSISVWNSLAGLSAGLPGCHGAGGVTAHYRLGSHTATATLFTGCLCRASRSFSATPSPCCSRSSFPGSGGDAALCRHPTRVAVGADGAGG